MYKMHLSPFYILLLTKIIMHFTSSARAKLHQITNTIQVGVFKFLFHLGKEKKLVVSKILC